MPSNYANRHTPPIHITHIRLPMKPRKRKRERCSTKKILSPILLSLHVSDRPVLRYHYTIPHYTILIFFALKPWVISSLPGPHASELIRTPARSQRAQQLTHMQLPAAGSLSTTCFIHVRAGYVFALTRGTGYASVVELICNNPTLLGSADTQPAT